MTQDIWRGRITYRSDLVARLTHLTGRKAKTDDEAFDILWNILIEKKLVASGHEGFIIGDTRAVCFQEVPLTALAENLLFEESIKRTDRGYSWFGIRINKGAFFKEGGLPVVYGNKNELQKIFPSNQHWRIVSLDLDDPNSIVDWTQEREWRFAGDYKFEWSNIEVILKDHKYFKKFITRCFDEKHQDILTQINGVVTLDSVLS